MVKQIEKLRPELELVVLHQGEILEQRAVKLIKAGRDHGVSSQIAEHADGRQHKLARIDICVRITWMDRVIVTTWNQAGSKIVSVSDRIHLSSPVFFNGERIAGTHREDSVQLPTLRHNAFPTVHRIESRNVVGEVARERMANVKGSQTALERHVPGVVAALPLDKVVTRARHAGAVVHRL